MGYLMSYRRFCVKKEVAVRLGDESWCFLEAVSVIFAFRMMKPPWVDEAILLDWLQLSLPLLTT